MKAISSIILLICVIVFNSCETNKKSKQPEYKNRLDIPVVVNTNSHIPIDSNRIKNFFNSYPQLKSYDSILSDLYHRNGFNYIWFDKAGLIEFAYSFYNKVNLIEDEGVFTKFPYFDKLEGVFNDETENLLSNPETEFMLSSLFIFYVDKIYSGIDPEKTKAIGWLLPRKQISYTVLLDSTLLVPDLLHKNEQALFYQYYLLADMLKKYREIEKRGGWGSIEVAPQFKSFKPGDTATAILQIRNKLYITGDLAINNQSMTYDPELLLAIKKYKSRCGFVSDSLILKKHIEQMNIPVTEFIKKIIVNMERCRWVTPGVLDAKEYIVVNIPSYKLIFFRDRKRELESPVVVGSMIHKTIIFSGDLTYIVFSPYWNVPPGIYNKEIKPALAKNKNYLATHNMEWNNGQLRQKPGKNNSLGQVKFIFPNSNNIYLHDTPAKSLFEKENRAFSHGCIRVGKPKELAVSILKDDVNWTPQKIEAAMQAGKEKTYRLKEKIPVYIGYFTAWVDNNGELHFYNDIYERDAPLFNLLTD